MISYVTFYPYKKGSRFDMDYYCDKHLVTAKKYFGDSCKGILVQKGNFEDGKEPRFACICHLFFNTAEEFFNGMEKASPELMPDVINYTDIEPVGEIVEVSMQE